MQPPPIQTPIFTAAGILSGPWATWFGLLASAVNDISPTSSFKGASLVLSGNQSLTSGAAAVVSWDSANEDRGGFWGGSLPTPAPTKLIIPAGVKRVILTGGIKFDNSSGGGQRTVNIKKNGGDFYGQPNHTLPVAATASFVLMQCETQVITVAKGDYFELFGEQSSGGALDMVAGDNTWFAIWAIE